MSNCGNADTPGAADGSQNANARSGRRRVDLAVVVVVHSLSYLVYFYHCLYFYYYPTYVIVSI